MTLNIPPKLQWQKRVIPWWKYQQPALSHVNEVMVTAPPLITCAIWSKNTWAHTSELCNLSLTRIIMKQSDTLKVCENLTPQMLPTGHVWCGGAYLKSWTWEVKAGGSIQSHPLPHSEIQARLAYRRLCFNKYLNKYILKNKMCVGGVAQWIKHSQCTWGPRFRCLEPTYNQESMVAANWEAEPTEAYASWLTQVESLSSRFSVRPYLNKYSSHRGRQMISTSGLHKAAPHTRTHTHKCRCTYTTHTCK